MPLAIELFTQFQWIQHTKTLKVHATWFVTEGYLYYVWRTFYMIWRIACCNWRLHNFDLKDQWFWRNLYMSQKDSLFVTEGYLTVSDGYFTWIWRILYWSEGPFVCLKDTLHGLKDRLVSEGYPYMSLKDSLPESEG